MSRLLIVHHTPSPFMQAMFEAVLTGATDPEIEGVEVVRRPALTVSPADMLEADGYVLGTPANLGYMSGALKHLLGGYHAISGFLGGFRGGYVYQSRRRSSMMRAAMNRFVSMGLTRICRLSIVTLSP